MDSTKLLFAIWKKQVHKQVMDFNKMIIREQTSNGKKSKGHYFGIVQHKV